jgi:predicted DNA-binding transcriptional regulator YafY
MYQGHNQEEPNEVEFHPYFIKQYNSRFFVFGYNPKYDNISNLAFDRIKSIEICSSEYMSNQDIDFDQYFEDIIGVTVPDSSKVQRVLIRVDSRLYKYLQTKPLHGSQKVVLTAEEYVDILLEVHLNYELESLLLSHGERLEILEPETLRSSISERVSALTKKYK